VLEQARPVLEARGNPSRRYAFYLYLGMQRVMRARLRADDQALAEIRRALVAARESRDTKDIGYGIYFLGWALALHGEREQARHQFTQSLEIADRVGESLLRANSLGSLVVMALSSHDVDTVRDLAPRAIAAAAPLGRNNVPWAMAPLAWLAWQDGRPDDVVRIAAEVDAADEVAAGDEAAAGAGNRYRWVYLLPLAATYLARSDPGQAVAAVRPLLNPGQQALPGRLEAALRAACGAWDTGGRDEAQGYEAQGYEARRDEVVARLQHALGIARDLGFF
jgi:hypothetical protein